MRNILSMAALFTAMLLGLSSTSLAAETSYYFGTSDKRTNITFESKTSFEDILGTANKLRGTLNLDLDAPVDKKKSVGTVNLRVPVASFKTGIALRDQHLRSPYWLNAKKNPLLTFTSKSLKRIGKQEYEVIGNFTLNGVSKTLKAQVRIVEIPTHIGPGW